MLSPVLASFEITDSHGKQEGRKDWKSQKREAAVGSPLFPLSGLRLVADRERERRVHGGSVAYPVCMISSVRLRDNFSE